MPPRPELQDDDARAVRACRHGSMDSFEPLVRRHAPRVIRLAYHFLGDWDEAKDLAQDAFARAYLCLHRYDESRPFGAWLTAIAARLAADRLRRRRVAARARASMASAHPAGLDPDLRLGLSEALERLTARQRQAVVLCDLHGFTAAESAEILGCTASTIRVQRFLARRRLRALLEQAGAPGSLDGLGAVAAEERR